MATPEEQDARAPADGLPSDRAAQWERWVVPALFAVVVLAWGAGVGFGKIRSFDYWWHLRTGQLIVETGAVPRTDPYSYTVPGARWIDLHWIFQVGVHGLYTLGGHEAVRTARGLLVCLLLGAAAAIGWRRERAAVTGLAVVLLAMVGSSRFLVRPDLVSFHLLLAVLALLWRHAERGGRAVFAIVPLQLLWTNVHGLFAVGLATVAMALVTEALRPALRPDAPLRRDHVARLLGVLGASAAASVLNPNGLEGATFPLQQLGMIGSWEARGLFGRAIDELRPALELGWLALAPSLALAALALAGLVARGRGVPAFDALLIVAFGYLALTARRNLALFAVVAVPVVTRNLGVAWARSLPATGRTVAATVILALLGVAGVVFARHELAFAWQHEGASSEAVSPVQFPEASVDWIARERPSGSLYHRMADGGYLIARLYPDYRVLVDGRLEMYGARTFARLEVVDGGRPEGFRRLDEDYGFGAALLHHAFLPGEELLAWLWRHPGWRLVQIDEVGAVFVREPPSGRLPWPALDPASPDLFPDREGPVRPALDLWRRERRIRLLAALGQPGRALQLADETLRIHRSASVLRLRDWLRQRAPLAPSRDP